MAKYPAEGSPHEDLIDEYAKAIGLLTIYWATLENSLLIVLERLLGIDETTATCIGTSLEKASSRATLIHRLVHRKGGSPSPQWTELIAGMCDQINNALGPQRNRLIHDDWFPKDTYMERQNKAVKVGKPSAHSAKELLANSSTPSHVHEIYSLTDRVVHLMVHLTIQTSMFKRWKETGQQPHIPEQAIRASKGLPPMDPPQDVED